MEVKVSEIPAEGRRIQLTEEPADIEGLGEDIKLAGPVRADVSLKKVGQTVYLKGRVSARLELECSRCGKTFGYDAETTLDLDINPAPQGQAGEEKELQAGDLEVDYYKDDTIDLKELLREQVILQAPMKALCSEECRGLCQYCGKDLNEGECGCEPPKGHPGLAGLKDFFKDKGGKE